MIKTNNKQKNRFRTNKNKLVVTLSDYIENINLVEKINLDINEIDELVITCNNDKELNFQTVNIKDTKIKSIYFDCKIKNINNILTFIDNCSNDITVYLKTYEKHPFNIDFKYILFIKNFIILENKELNLEINNNEYELSLTQDEYLILKKNEITKKMKDFPFILENKNIFIKIINFENNQMEFKFKNCTIQIESDVDIDKMEFIRCKINPELHSFNLNGILDLYSSKNIKKPELIKNIHQIKISSSVSSKKIIIFDYLYAKILDYNPKIIKLIMLLAFNTILGSIFFEQSNMTYDYMQNKNNIPPFNSLLYSLDLALPVNINTSSKWIPIFNSQNKYMNYYYYYMIIFNKLLWGLIVYGFYSKWKKEHV